MTVKANWLRWAPLLPLLIAGCSSSGPPVSADELVVKAQAARRGAELGLALACGADARLIIDRGEHDPAPPSVRPDLRRVYSAHLFTLVRSEEGLRGNGTNQFLDCELVRNRPEYASLWPSTRPERPPTPPRAAVRP